jgi:hypothetical protein
MTEHNFLTRQVMQAHKSEFIENVKDIPADAAYLCYYVKCVGNFGKLFCWIVTNHEKHIDDELDFDKHVFVNEQMRIINQLTEHDKIIKQGHAHTFTNRMCHFKKYFNTAVYEKTMEKLPCGERTRVKFVTMNYLFSNVLHKYKSFVSPRLSPGHICVIYSSSFLAHGNEIRCFIGFNDKYYIFTTSLQDYIDYQRKDLSSGANKKITEKELEDFSKMRTQLFQPLMKALREYLPLPSNEKPEMKIFADDEFAFMPYSSILIDQVEHSSGGKTFLMDQFKLSYSISPTLDRYYIASRDTVIQRDVIISMDPVSKFIDRF